MTATGTLASESLGRGDETVVFVHGFTQTRAAWRDIAARFADTRPQCRCLLVDLPGHGDSGVGATSISETAQQLVAVGDNAVYVGYSLGARVVLQALVDFPDRVRAAVSISGTGGIDDESERTARRASDAHLAERVHEIGIDAFLREWLALPIFADMTSDEAMMSDRLRNTPSGLAHSLLTCGQGQQAPLWNALHSCPRPVLAVAGSRDTKYVALARRLAATVPNGSLDIIHNAGHNVPATHAGDVVRIISEWLTRINQ